MGKKGSWLSAIKRVFTSNSKEKPLNEAEKKARLKHGKEKGKGKGKEKRSFIPLFREPSSIEKILGEVDQHNLFTQHSHPPPPPPRVTSPPRAPSPRVSSPPRAASPRVTSPPRAASPRVTSPPRAASPKAIPSPRVVHPQPTPQRHASATRIQAAYRGFMARRTFRGFTGLVRLRGVVRGQHVKRQTVNAMKQMQLLVRVQTQIQSRRIQMLENQAPKRQPNNNPKQPDGKNLMETGDEEWDDSVITKEEREARLQRRVKAVVKRERAMAYAYSNQLWKAAPKSAEKSLMDIRSGGYPWWWSWLERQLPSDTKNPSRPRPQSSNHKQSDTPTSRSMVPWRTRQPPMTPTPSMIKYSKTKGSPSPSVGYPMKDDDSLMSCPPFSVPNYMSPTVSAKAKANPKDRFPNRGSDSSKRRFSFPQTPNGWNKGTPTRHKSPGSVGDLSMDSAISMPATLGRRPFNRFV